MIVYNKQYNISAFGLEKFHPFDVTKYSRVHSMLKNRYGMIDSDFISPLGPISDDEMSKVQTPEYLESLRKDKSVSLDIFGVPEMKILPVSLMNRLVLDPMRWATAGTVVAVQLALDHGWSMNLGGGYHHASRDFGCGFCVFADTALALNHVWSKFPNKKVMIIDTDAHHGNGNDDFFRDDDRVCIVDIHTYSFHSDFKLEYETPYQISRRKWSDYKKFFDSGYLSLVRRIEKQIDIFKPELIIHNSGSDILDGDSIGGYHISDDGLIRRDEIIWRAARSRGIPITYLFAGGYTKKSANVIFRSICNLVDNNIIFSDKMRSENIKAGILPEEPYLVPDIKLKPVEYKKKKKEIKEGDIDDIFIGDYCDGCNKFSVKYVEDNRNICPNCGSQEWIFQGGSDDR